MGHHDPRTTNWFRPRKKIYGEGLEIGVDELRMTDEEAAQVLAAAGAEAGRARVMRTAAGWPPYSASPR